MQILGTILAKKTLDSMVTAAQLQIVQSPITNLILNVSVSVMIKLDETNYLAWHYQM